MPLTENEYKSNNRTYARRQQLALTMLDMLEEIKDSITVDAVLTIMRKALTGGEIAKQR